jgi:hypothetical protein
MWNYVDVWVGMSSDIFQPLAPARAVGEPTKKQMVSYHFLIIFLIKQLPCLIHVLRISQVSHLFCSGNPWTFSDMDSACFKDIPRIFRATHISVP